MKEAADQKTDEENWLEHVADLWEERLPHLRKKLLTDIKRPTADQYGFQKEEREDQTSDNKLGAAILKEIAGGEEVKELPPEDVASEDVEEEEEVESGREKVKEMKLTDDSPPHENCKH